MRRNGTSCTPAYWFHERTRAESEDRLRQQMAEAERNGHRAIGTNWAPDTVGAGGWTDAFATQPIRDFRIAVPASPHEVGVCVRDHQWEDGDRVRVSVNRSVLLSSETFNAWHCQTVSLRKGRHDIELFAVNGRGYKGGCSYIDGNTGELRVTGQDAQIQSWCHRGGKGSSARIVQTVR